MRNSRGGPGKQEGHGLLTPVPSELTPHAQAAFGPGVPVPPEQLPAVPACLPGLCRQAGLHEVRLHDLRHTYGVHCARAGVPLVRIQKLMGHATLAMTLRYLQHAPESHFAQDAALVAESLSRARDTEAQAAAELGDTPSLADQRRLVPGRCVTGIATSPAGHAAGFNQRAALASRRPSHAPTGPSRGSCRSPSVRRDASLRAAATLSPRADLGWTTVISWVLSQDGADRMASSKTLAAP
jgi:hypothetical protein